MSGGVHWLTAFLDTPADRAPAAEDFWVAVTGYRVSERRGECSEFASLLPPAGDPHLKLQRVAEQPPGGLHLDLHTDDVRALVGRTGALGGRVLAVEDDYVVCASPGGMTFCAVDHAASRPAAPTSWPGGRSMVDQVCLDIPPDRWDDECRFWAELTGWELVDRDPDDEFRRLRRPEGLPVQVLLQRLDDEAELVTAHIDLGTDDVEAEAQRHLTLGAAVVRRRPPHWVTLEDPTGRTYCVTAHPVGRPAV